MRKSLLIVASIFTAISFSVFANNPNSIPQSLLDEVANDIDNICGDTWCEGDFDWSFTNLKCDLKAGNCTIDLTQISEDFIYEEGQFNNILNLEFSNEMAKSFKEAEVLTHRNRQTLNVYETCEMNGFTKYEDVIENNSYSEKLYDYISDCIGEMETKFHQDVLKAEIKASFNLCPTLSVREVVEDTDPNRVNDGYYYFYNEQNAWNDLKTYASEKNLYTENSNRYFLRYFGNEGDSDNYCRQAIDRLDQTMYSLVINPRGTWNNNEYPVLLSGKISNTRVKLIVVKNK